MRAALLALDVPWCDVSGNLVPGGTYVVTNHGQPGDACVLVFGLDVNTATPIDEETTDVSFAYTTKRSEGGGKGVGAALIRDLEKQMEQDIVIWEHKAYWQRPVLCDGDGEIGTYRRWWRQFFSEAW